MLIFLNLTVVCDGVSGVLNVSSPEAIQVNGLWTKTRHFAAAVYCNIYVDQGLTVYNFYFSAQFNVSVHCGTISQVMQTILEEVATIFPGQYMHFGGDEVRKCFHDEEMKRHISHTQEVTDLRHHFAVVLDVAQRHNKIPVVWEVSYGSLFLSRICTMTSRRSIGQCVAWALVSTVSLALFCKKTTGSV